jgi:predicted metal-dependent phosphoesterase TrpH
MSSSHASRSTGVGLLCELHAHSRWSDGELDLPDVVDLYGRAGLDVLCITDHVVRDGGFVSGAVYPAYRSAIAEQALRAWDRYRMIVIPGLELTWDDHDDARAAHAVVIGIDRFVGLDDGLDAAVEVARDQGAAIIAGHPHGIADDRLPGRTTRRWWLDRRLRSLAHRFELINRTQVFDWVAAAGVPAVASGDFHRAEHLSTWKTVLPAERDPAAVVDYLRSRAPAMITPAVALSAVRPAPHDQPQMPLLADASRA